MPSVSQKVSRTPIHKRFITTQVYERDDGLWDLEATLIDKKDYDFRLKCGELHQAGTPVHHMKVCVTVDKRYNIVDASAHYQAAPYGPACTSIASDYQKLIGLNLVRGFRHAMREKFKRTAGCTHMTELCQVLPTLAIQGIAPRLARLGHCQPNEKRKPYAIDGCHALKADGEVVKEHYPLWYQAPTKRWDNN